MRFEVNKQTFLLKENANFSTFFRKVRVLPCYGKKDTKISLFFKRFIAIFKSFCHNGILYGGNAMLSSKCNKRNFSETHGIMFLHTPITFSYDTIQETSTKIGLLT